MAAPVPAMSASFPKGLRVLLVDDEPSRSFVEAQLQQPDLAYSVTSCGSAAEALSYCQPGVAAFDVILAESKVVAPEDCVGRAFIVAFASTPVVLMSEGGTTEDVMRAVQLGAVDFLDKPLSLLRLKNIWQHSVRKLMACQPGMSTEPEFANSKRPSLDSPGTPSVQDAETYSAGSFPTETCFTGGELEMIDDDSGSGHATRPPLGFKASTFGPMNSLPPASQWPALQPGCVWGTPVGGPMGPPALCNSLKEGYLRRAESFAAPPVDGLLVKGGGPPIGLKLDVSDSLLNMINGALCAKAMTI